MALFDMFTMLEKFRLLELMYANDDSSKDESGDKEERARDKKEREYLQQRLGKKEEAQNKEIARWIRLLLHTNRKLKNKHNDKILDQERWLIEAYLVKNLDPKDPFKWESAQTEWLSVMRTKKDRSDDPLIKLGLDEDSNIAAIEEMAKKALMDLAHTHYMQLTPRLERLGTWASGLGLALTISAAAKAIATALIPLLPFALPAASVITAIGLIALAVGFVVGVTVAILVARSTQFKEMRSSLISNIKNKANIKQTKEFKIPKDTAMHLKQRESEKNYKEAHPEIAQEATLASTRQLLVDFKAEIASTIATSIKPLKDKIGELKTTVGNLKDAIETPKESGERNDPPTAEEIATMIQDAIRPIATQIGTLVAQIGTLKEAIETSKKSEKSDGLAELQQRLQTLETAIAASLRQTSESLKSEMQTQQSAITELNHLVTEKINTQNHSLTTALVALQQSVANLSGAFTKESLEQLDRSFAQLEGRAGNLNTTLTRGTTLTTILAEILALADSLNSFIEAKTPGSPGRTSPSHLNNNSQISAPSPELSILFQY